MEILDTTVRDGSYAIDFKFSCKDVMDLVSRSERLGTKYIEIGHGQGLNASSLEHGFSLHSDMEYIDAARKAAETSKIGMFCIPGIARIDDIDYAAEHGLDFIRIGINAEDYDKTLPFIKRSDDLGIEVFVNLMKTYTVDASVFADAAEYAESNNVKVLYIVDSAGCMTTDELDDYIDAARERSRIKIGYHGHNNLGLAVSNTVHCVIKKNIDFIDVSFQGLGRSLGNASYEQVVMLLQKNGYDLGYDIPRLLEYGYAGLRNIVRGALTNPLDYMCGYAGFHSGFLKDIYRCSNEKKVDPLRLILAYSTENKSTMDYDRLCEVADMLPEDTDDNPYNFAEYFMDRYND